MSEFVRLLAHSSSEDQLLAEAAQLAQERLQADSVDIILSTASGEVVLRASTSHPDFVGRVRFSSQKGVTGHVIETGEVVVRQLGDQHPEEIRFPGTEREEFAFEVFAPLADLGVLVVRYRSHEPSPEIGEVSREIALALAGWRRAYEMGGHADRLGALSEVTQSIATSPYVEEIIQLLVNVTAEQFGYKVCTVRLLDESSEELVLRATQAKSSEYQRKRSIRVGESIAGRAVVEQRPIVVPDVLSEDEYIGHELAAQQGLASMICVPLTIEDHAIGVLTCYTEEPHDFSPVEISALETIAQQAAFSIERAKLQVRSTLMQEMHHRVKNNLQQIVSLLRLQLTHRHYGSIDEAINDSIHRILAISAVHDLLSREDLDRVDLKTIAETLVGHLQQSYLTPQKAFQFDVRGDHVRLSMTQATQVALMLNELLLNAVEHGFAGAEGGEVHVTFEVADDRVSLWVANNGHPLPAGFDISTSGNLGLQIVTSLARGLGGTFRLYDSHSWAVAEVKFTRVTSD
ncbi:MAG: GAF domain-containing protein [Fimbriimonadaceae bacterium]|nr:GAF domain-containing protein [Fimbriimonadaceae bacterium]